MTEKEHESISYRRNTVKLERPLIAVLASLLRYLTHETRICEVSAGVATKLFETKTVQISKIS